MLGGTSDENFFAAIEVQKNIDAIFASEELESVAFLAGGYKRELMTKGVFKLPTCWSCDVH